MGYDPELYALTHTGTPGDVSFYLRVCRGVSRLLELGCGAGRMLAALARAGHDVTGIESDPEMLEFARQQREQLPEAIRRHITLTAGDMREERPQGAFYDRVLIPYNGLYCLLSDAEVVSCFTAARRALRAGGALVFDAYAVHREDLACAEGAGADPGEEHREAVATLHYRGGRVRVFEQSSWDLPRQLLLATYLYLDEQGESATEQPCTIPQRYLFVDQVPSLLERAGFFIEELYGDFRGTPYGEESQHMVIVARVTKGD